MASSIQDVLVRHGATIAPVHGQPLAARFGEPADEWRAAREGCAVFAATFRGFVHATGADRVSFLQGMLSNDVKSLAPGQGLHAAFLTQQAKVISDLRVFADEDRIILDALRWSVGPLADGLERYLVADDVELTRTAEEAPLVGLEGPAAKVILGELFGAGPIGAGPYRHHAVTWKDTPCRVIEVSEVSGCGFLISGPERIAGALFDALRDAGATPMGMDAFNVLRVERGVPWTGIDMDENVLLMEVGLDDAVSFKKGCYLGQEVVERVTARGHVNRRLTGLLLGGAEVVPAGSTVFSDDAEVGWTASSVESFALQCPIALAYLRREILEPGRRLRVVNNERPLDAILHPLPFVTGVGP